MKEYIEIAKQYFRHLEGLHLYPSLRSAWSVTWFIITGIWLVALVRFAVLGHPSSNETGFVTILVPEVLWLLVTFRIHALKERRLVEETNHRLGTAFRTPTECRRHVLAGAVGVPPSEFLRIAKDIDELLSLQQKFRKHSDQSWAELGRRIYDRDSKARLLTLVIALVSIIVALTARSDATLETLFEVYSQPSARALLAMLAWGVAIFFFLYIGLQVFLRTIVDVLASWSTKLFGGSPRWLVGYLVRDLALYYSAVELDEKQKPRQSVEQRGIDTGIDEEPATLHTLGERSDRSAVVTGELDVAGSHILHDAPDRGAQSNSIWSARFVQEVWQRTRTFAVSLVRCTSVDDR